LTKHRNIIELCSCIASESRKFFNRVFYLKQINFITGGPLAAGSLGQLPPLPPLNPALPVRKLLFYSDINHIFYETNKHNPFSGHMAYLCRFEVAIFQEIQNTVY